MTVEERIKKSISSVFMTVFPSSTNHHDTMFGGKAMALMDEVAFIAGTRFCRKSLVTVSSDKIDFHKPIPSGSIIEVQGKVKEIGRTSLKVEVKIYVEQMLEEGRELSIKGLFTFVALDENKKPTPVLEGLPLEI